MAVKPSGATSIFGLELHVIEERAVFELRQRVQIGADAILAYPHAAQADFERAIFREKVGGLVPLAFIDVIAVCGLQVGDGDEVLRILHLLLKLGDGGFQGFDFSRHVLFFAVSPRRCAISEGHTKQRQHQKNCERAHSHWKMPPFFVYCVDGGR